MPAHGVGIDIYHAGLLTPLDIAWWLMILAIIAIERHPRYSSAVAGRAAAGVAGIVLAVTAATSGLAAAALLASVFARWAAYTYAGLRVERWRARLEHPAT